MDETRSSGIDLPIEPANSPRVGADSEKIPRAKFCPRWDSNLESTSSESDAITTRPSGTGSTVYYSIEDYVVTFDVREMIEQVHYI